MMLKKIFSQVKKKNGSIPVDDDDALKSPVVDQNASIDATEDETADTRPNADTPDTSSSSEDNDGKDSEDFSISESTASLGKGPRTTRRARRAQMAVELSASMHGSAVFDIQGGPDQLRSRAEMMAEAAAGRSSRRAMGLARQPSARSSRRNLGALPEAPSARGRSLMGISEASDLIPESRRRSGSRSSRRLDQSLKKETDDFDKETQNADERKRSRSSSREGRRGRSHRNVLSSPKKDDRETRESQSDARKRASSRDRAERRKRSSSKDKIGDRKRSSSRDRIEERRRSSSKDRTAESSATDSPRRRSTSKDRKRDGSVTNSPRRRSSSKDGRHGRRGRSVDGPKSRSENGTSKENNGTDMKHQSSRSSSKERGRRSRSSDRLSARRSNSKDRGNSKRSNSLGRRDKSRERMVTRRDPLKTQQSVRALFMGISVQDSLGNEPETDNKPNDLKSNTSSEESSTMTPDTNNPCEKKDTENGSASSLSHSRGTQSPKRRSRSREGRMARSTSKDRLLKKSQRWGVDEDEAKTKVEEINTGNDTPADSQIQPTTPKKKKQVPDQIESPATKPTEKQIKKDIKSPEKVVSRPCPAVIFHNEESTNQDNPVEVEKEESESEAEDNGMMALLFNHLDHISEEGTEKREANRASVGTSNESSGADEVMSTPKKQPNTTTSKKTFSPPSSTGSRSKKQASSPKKNGTPKKDSGERTGRLNTPSPLKREADSFTSDMNLKDENDVKGSTDIRMKSETQKPTLENNLMALLGHIGSSDQDFVDADTAVNVLDAKLETKEQQSSLDFFKGLKSPGAHSCSTTNTSKSHHGKSSKPRSSRSMSKSIISEDSTQNSSTEDKKKRNRRIKRTPSTKSYSPPRVAMHSRTGDALASPKGGLAPPSLAGDQDSRKPRSMRLPKDERKPRSKIRRNDPNRGIKPAKSSESFFDRDDLEPVPETKPSICRKIRRLKKDPNNPLDDICDQSLAPPSIAEDEFEKPKAMRTKSLDDLEDMDVEHKNSKSSRKLSKRSLGLKKSRSLSRVGRCDEVPSEGGRRSSLLKAQSALNLQNKKSRGMARNAVSSRNILDT